jgi:glycosyltransferase involved in cell wall biosynthesis
MNICFHAPFKPLGHPDPSGDLVIGTGLYDFLSNRGHTLWAVSNLRCRWIYWKPWLIPQIIKEIRHAKRAVEKRTPDLWLTYHSYYKAPDVLGPWVCQNKKIPYVIFQGVYATKRRKVFRTLPGFMLNTRSLKAAHHVFANKKIDLINLKRILERSKRTYVAPGIFPHEFSNSAEDRRKLRTEWGVGDDPVVITAAMFRPDVKTAGLKIVIRACGELLRKGKKFYLVIAGDGKTKHDLKSLADKEASGRVRFIGKIPRKDMYRFYSAGDLFAFPGIRESLGMVFLEAQSCGIPVVAYANEGTPEVINHPQTGFLVPAFDFEAFVYSIEILLDNTTLRRNMGARGKRYVRKHHDLNKNYRIVEDVLMGLCKGGEL